MRFRTLALLPLAFAILFAAVEAFGLGDAALPRALVIENEAGKGLGLAGAFVAVLAFERGDYLGRAWGYGAASMLLLLVNDGFRASSFAASLTAHDLAVAAGLISLLANASSVVSTFMLARAWNVAGLGGDDAGRRRRMFVGAVLVSLLVTGWPLTQDAVAVWHGHLETLVSISSDVGDTLCLALLAPVMLTALAMRGGVLLWPWGLLTACGVAWIGYDLVVGAVEVLHLEQARWLIAIEALRALANVAYFSSGVAQRFVAQGALTEEQPAAA
jgi:hypothetical protein